MALDPQTDVPLSKQTAESFWSYDLYRIFWAIANANSTPSQMPYKSYQATISQAGTDDPVAQELYNDTGLTIEFSRTNVGNYIATLSSGIDTAYAMAFIGGTYENGDPTSVNNFQNAWFSLNTEITISTMRFSSGNFEPVDNWLNNTPFEIRIYPQP